MAKKSRKLPVASASVPECMPSKPTSAQKEQERRWKAEDALRSIQRAEEVKRDKDLMKDVRELATEQVNNLKKFMK